MAILSLVVITVAIVGWICLRSIETFRKTKAQVSTCQLPGPQGLPFLGIAHMIPRKCSWMKFAEWAEEYGPIYQTNIAGQNHVWISRDKVAHDLLSKRSAIYSDRPFIPALEHDNRTSGQYLPLMSKNSIWSRQRRFVKQILDKSAQEDFYSYPELESIRLLFELMADPSRYNHAMESYVARITSRLAWGTPTASEELKQRARELLIGVSPSGSLGNRLPLVMSLSRRLSKPKQWELRRGRTEHRFFQLMQDEVRQFLEQGAETQPKSSWTRIFLEQKKTWGFKSDCEGSAAVGMQGIAGALTIAAPMQSFCLAMCHYPQYQSFLHEEIDRVLGDRMPTFADMTKMPVLRAFIRETMRWRPPIPTGIPHALTEDDVYEGYHIPKGSVIHPFEWSISRDPEVFPEPDDWNPMRWLDSKYPTFREPLSKYPTITGYSAFGYGRRTCQGMSYTEADLFVGLGSVAWLFSMHGDVEPPVKAEPQQQTSVEEEETPGHQDCFSNNEAGEISDSHSQSDTSSPRLTLKRLSTHVKDSAVCILDDSTDLVGHDSGIKSDDSDAASSIQGSVSDIAHGCDAPSEPEPLTAERSPPESDMPGSWKFANVGKVTEYEIPSKPRQVPHYQDDPTFNFSTLLIAKPLPIKFQLAVRSQTRAELVAQQWVRMKMLGEFPEARVYWKDSNKGDAECGWGEVYS